MRKRGDFQLSFSMIFSIVVIIAIVAVAFYVIAYFVNVNKCGQAGNFYKSLQDKVNVAYRGEITETTFEGVVPNGVDYVCVGEVSLGTGNPKDDEEREMYNYLRLHAEDDKNLILYPESEACDGEMAYLELEHVRTEGDKLFCVKSKSGKIVLRLSKRATDALVLVSE